MNEYIVAGLQKELEEIVARYNEINEKIKMVEEMSQDDRDRLDSMTKEADAILKSQQKIIMKDHWGIKREV